MFIPVTTVVRQFSSFKQQKTGPKLTKRVPTAVHNNLNRQLNRHENEFAAACASASEKRKSTLDPLRKASPVTGSLSAAYTAY